MADKEFNFWKAHESISEEKFNDHKSCIDLVSQVDEDHTEQGFGASPSPLLLWKHTTSSRNIKHESSSFLPPPHQVYSDPLTRSRRQIIIEGRKELMDSIRNMPESCYELSLKDIVDEQHSLEKNDQENLKQDDCLKFEAGTQIRKEKIGQILRSESMESEKFMLKMFFPTSLGSMKKTKARKFSKDFWTFSSEGSDDFVDKDSWIKRILFARKCKKISRSNTNGSTNSCSSITSTNRWDDNNYVPGCWFFFFGKKSKNNKCGCFC